MQSVYKFLGPSRYLFDHMRTRHWRLKLHRIGADGLRGFAGPPGAPGVGGKDGLPGFPGERGPPVSIPQNKNYVKRTFISSYRHGNVEFARRPSPFLRLKNTKV